MYCLTTVLILILSLVRDNHSVGEPTKLIYKKDLSEHCRRRVVPSIFLGRQVMEANARILLFSRLDLPYSCFLSIRTESGSNMVMVVKLKPNELKRACNKNSEQLMVYEMGETFGGYWGPLPDSVMKRESPKAQMYTIKTTPQTTEITQSSLSEEESEDEILVQTSTVSREQSGQSTGDYVEVEVPLLNLSVHLVPGEVPPSRGLEIDETFDLRNDVTPIPGVSYDRSVFPLVQFHVAEQNGGWRSVGDGAPRYELDILEQFTPDTRLTLPRLNPTSKRRNILKKQRYHASKRLNFKKHRTLDSRDRRLMSQITRRRDDITKYVFPTIKTTTKKAKSQHAPDSWQVIEDLMRKLDKTKESINVTKTTLSVNDTIIMENISNMNHSKSVYLSPNLTIYSSNDASKSKQISTTNALPNSTWKPTTKESENYNNKRKIATQTEMTSTIIIEDITANRILYNNPTRHPELSIEDFFVKETQTQQKPLTLTQTSLKSEIIESTSETDPTTFAIETAILKEEKQENLYKSKNNEETGSMVGHESWENVVQAAPEMAVLLNRTVGDEIAGDNTSDDTIEELNDTSHQNKLLNRKKRDIHSISIEYARPHSLSTKRRPSSTTKSSFEVADMQEFAQLVELQDDELHGRVALRYLRQYVGPALFNLCDLGETTTRHVHLFNSSRIVMAITNFTLSRMTVILTAARTLLIGETRCPNAQLECQVAGARVCLDSLVACDGVPNCGSYDIYDEDRLLCGRSIGLQHNVYLAAFTFLAVLLTILYAVHYWLKRCVPKVADAFFVYTDGAENVMYLDTIMRSPNDTDEMAKMVYHSNMYGDDNIYDDEDITTPKINAFKRFLRRLCFCFRKKQTKRNLMETSHPLSFSQALSKRMYSFTELEIRKMLTTSKETAVQTGDSLEMKFIQNIRGKHAVHPSSSTERTVSPDFPIMIQDSMFSLKNPLPEEHSEELSLLKFFNDARTGSVGSLSNKVTSENKAQDLRFDMSSEKELRSHAYVPQPGPSKSRKKTTDKTTHIPIPSNANKHLRFDDVTTTIPTSDHDDEDDEDGTVSIDRRRSVALGENRPWRGGRLLDTIEEGDEHSTTNKEHRHFWGSTKAKKTKKKPHFPQR